MEIKVKQGSLTDVECDVLIVSLFENVLVPAGATASVDKAIGDLILSVVIEQDKFKGKLGETYVLPTYGKIPAKKILIMGLGKVDEYNLNAVRQVASKAIQKAESFLKAKKVSTILHETTDFNPQDCAQMLTEGSLIGGYKFKKYKTQSDDDYKGIQELSIVEIESSKIDAINKGVAKGQIIAEAVNFARNLINEPAGEMTPSKLAQAASGIEGLECVVKEEAEVEKLGMGAYLAVSKGSLEPPKFIHLTYKPKNTARKKIAIVGKGITFDSGGLDIKPSSSMLNMKDDMSGAAATIAIMQALTKLNPEVEVHGIVASCENMPGNKAYKPGDVLKSMNGKTIEVDNTDAEGRLTLADALTYAQTLKVDQVIDMATLTGACMVALGYMASGIMSNNQELVDNLINSAEKGGERLWQLPLYKEYMEGLKSDIADFKNAGSRYAGASVAGVFLREFIENDIPWAHIDIAGPAFIDKEIKELPKGPTGVGVRTILNYILSI